MNTQSVSGVISDKFLRQIIADQSKADWKDKFSNLREHHERSQKPVTVKQVKQQPLPLFSYHSKNILA